MAGNPANASSVRSIRLSRQPATFRMMLVLILLGVSTLVLNGTFWPWTSPSPFFRSPGPVVLACHEARGGRGVSATRSSRHPLPCNRWIRKERSRKKEKRWHTQPCFLSDLPILVPRTTEWARLLSTTGICERRCPGSNSSSRDFVWRTECHSTPERGSRGEDETAVPCSNDPWSQPPNRTSLSTSYKIHGHVYRVYHKSPQLAREKRWAEANQQNPERRVDQTTFPRARSSSPNYIRGHLFFSSHPPPRGALELELRRRRHTGGLQQSVDTITSQVSTPLAIRVRRSHWRYPRGEHSRQRDRPRRTANPSRSVLNNSRIMWTLIPIPSVEGSTWPSNLQSEKPGAVCGQRKLPPSFHQSTDRPGPHFYSQKSLEQFADNVNSHPASLGHGDPYQDPKYQASRGKRSRGPISPSLAWPTTVRHPEAARRNTVSDDGRVTPFLRKKKVWAAGKGGPAAHCRDCRIIPARFV